MTLTLNKIAIADPPDTVLSYGITTNPDPLQVSTTGSIKISVSKLAPPAVQCNSLVLAIAVGTAASTLTPSASAIITTYPQGWTTTIDGNGTFTFTPAPGQGQISSNGLIFELNNIAINDQVGTTLLTITENLTTGSNTLTSPLSKFPANFTVSDLTADHDSIGPGGNVTLSWSGSAGGSYSLSYNDQTLSGLSNQGKQTIQNLQETTTFTLLVTAAGGSIQVKRQYTVTVVRAEIDQFIAFPLTLGKGAICHISWQTNADQCVLDPGSQTVAAPNGATTLSFDQSTNLTLTAIKGSDIAQQSRSITVVPPVIQSFTATPTGVINAGDSVTLQWATQFAETVSLSPDIGTVQASDSIVVNPKNTTNYVLTCTGLGNPVVQTVTVTVNSVKIDSFTVNPTVTNPGDVATLSWTVERATLASIDNGIGAVALPSGTHQVNPQRDTTYTLTCEGPNGPVVQQVTLPTNCVKILDFWNKCIDGVMCEWPGGKFQICWDTQNATKTELWYNGQVVATESATYVYQNSYDKEVFTLKAYGPAEPVTATLTLQYND